jgi:hypothetical protein
MNTISLMLILSSNVGLHLSYRGPKDSPVDTPTLRRALSLFPGTKDLYVEWKISLAANPGSFLPQIPTTRHAALTKPP